VALAGFMRLLTPQFVTAWKDKLVNIHPALLPAFPGLDTHKRALAAGVRFHGATVHFVRHETDTGPIIAQAAVPVLPGDDESALAARVLHAEHRIYPLALRLIAEGKVRVEGERAVITDAAFTESALFNPAPL
jgi:phosphoribosylglycinamide formyltransferase-1